jgi:hypothetical protein
MYRNYPFFKDLLDVFKTELGTTNGFSSVVIYCAWTSLMLLVQIFTARGPAHMRSAPRSLEGPKNQSTEQQKRLFFLPHFFIILFHFKFYSSLSIDTYNFFKYDHGFFMFTRDLNCSPQKPFLSVFLLDALSILKSVYSNRFFSLLHRRSETNLRFLALCMV